MSLPTRDFYSSGRSSSILARARNDLNRVDGQVLRLIAKEGKLQTVDMDGNARPLRALGDNRFRFEAYPVVLEFSGTGAERVIKTRFGDEKAATLQLVPDFAPTPADLNEYASLFATEEFDARYRMQVTDGKLYVATLKRNPMPLMPVTKDIFFVNDVGTVTFVRAGGRINGFSLSTGRVWNNEFAKLE